MNNLVREVDDAYRGHYGPFRVNCLRLVVIEWLSQDTVRLLSDYQSPGHMAWIYLYVTGPGGINELVICNGHEIKAVDYRGNNVWKVVKQPTWHVLTLKLITEMVQATILKDYALI